MLEDPTSCELERGEMGKWKSKQLRPDMLMRVLEPRLMFDAAQQGQVTLALV